MQRQAYFRKTNGYEVVPESEVSYRTRQTRTYGRRAITSVSALPSMSLTQIVDSMLHNRVALGFVGGAVLGAVIGVAGNLATDETIALIVVLAIGGAVVLYVLPLVFKSMVFLAAL